MAMKTSAGLLMYHRTQNGVECFLVHPGGPFFKNKDDGFWSVPKGEVHADGDDLLETAIREFEEETGNRPPADVQLLPLSTVALKSGKIVHCWAFEGELVKPFISNTFAIEWPPRTGKTREFPEVDRGEFFDPETAKRKLDANQAQFIDRLLAALVVDLKLLHSAESD